MKRSGFTLLEAVIALAVVTIVAGVAVQALVTSLRAEQQALHLSETRLAMERVLTATRLEAPASEDPMWRRDEREEFTGSATNRTRWLLLSLIPADGGKSACCALRRPAGEQDRERWK